MFSSSSELAPVSGRAWGIAIGTVVAVFAPAMLVSAKLAQVALPLLLAVALAGAVVRGRWRVCIPPLNGATICLAAILSYALVSALWAHWPLEAVLVAAVGAAVAWGSITAMQALHSEGRAGALHIAEGLWMGLLVGLVYALIEVVSDQAIKIWVYNALGLGPGELEPDRYFTWDGDGRLIAVHTDDLKRNLMPVSLLLWSALIAARTITSGVTRNIMMAALVIVSLAAVLLSPSYTCKIAMSASLLTFLCACYLPRLTWWGLALAWLMACLAAVPIAFAARALELQDAGWLPLSAQLRIVIWNEIAQLVANAPIFGVGADMTYFTQPPLHEAPAAAPDWLGFPVPHPHNVYLQTWYELGLVGAVLLAGFGLALLQRIAAAASTARPFLYATFAGAAVEIGMSYNLWQIWFLCLFGFTAPMCALAVNLTQSGPQSAGAR